MGPAPRKRSVYGWSLILTALGLRCSALDFSQVKLTDVDEKAVCNDGSPGMMYVRPGSGAGAAKWVIRLEGGGWCSDLASCNQRIVRLPGLMSSQQNPPALSTFAVYGILSADPASNPYMHDWNHVSIVYCSSDSFLGDVGPADSTQAGSWQFRGKRIVKAAAQKLVGRHNFTDAIDILFSGESAGGVAAMNNAAVFKSIIAPSAPALRTFSCLVDGGWFMDIPSYSTALDAFTFRSNAMKLQNNWNASFDANCTAQYGASLAWMCFFAQYAWPYVPVPLLFHQFLYDTASLGFLSASSPAQLQDFRSKMTATLTEPAGSIRMPSNVTLQSTAVHGSVQTFMTVPGDLPSVFAPAQSAHTIIDNIAFAVNKINSTAFTDVLAAWFTGRNSDVSIIDGTVSLLDRR